MTEEQKDLKDLLIRDLCARLPYGVKVESVFINPDTKEHKSCGIEVFNATSLLMIRDGLGEFKPYLFPLSSMTLEQRCKASYIIPEISIAKQKIIFYENGGSVKLEQLDKLFNFFNLHHIDYRGLIEKGLANDATGLNIY